MKGQKNLIGWQFHITNLSDTMDHDIHETYEIVGLDGLPKLTKEAIKKYGSENISIRPVLSGEVENPMFI